MPAVPPALLPALAQAANGTAPGEPVLPGDLTMWQAAAVGLGLGALAVVFLQRIRGIVPPDNPEKELTLQEHLEELQHRLVTVLVAWAFLALLFFSFGPETLRVAGYEIPLLVPTVHGSFSALGLAHLQAQFVPATVTVVVLRPVDAILAQLTVALLMAIVVSAPVAGYEVAAFLAPGLKPSERRLALRVTPVVSLLFLAGAAFAYLVMVPVTMEVLYGYAAAVGAQEFLQIDELVNFVVLLHVLFGIAFELPVIMAALSEVGLVDPDDWVRYWRHAVVVIVVLAAMVSDPSPVTQLIVAGPVILLYGLGVAASRWRAGGTGEDGN